MLRKELLVVKKYKPDISPVFATDDELSLLEEVMDCYHQGESRGDIRDEVAELETQQNFKRVRGFADIIERHCTFEEQWTIQPRELRSYLYQEGYAATEQQRHRIIEQAATHFEVDRETIEMDFWADQDDSHILVEAPEVDPEALLRQYNLSLVQTLLFDALGLRITVSGRYQQIFGMIKYLGLMYHAERSKGATVVTVTGPASLFKKTRKYGTTLARLIPTVVRAPGWRIQAQVETRVMGEQRIYEFDLDDSKRDLLPSYKEAEDEEKAESFDSMVEASFARRFRALDKDWRLVREPDILVAGHQVMIPDFCFQRRGQQLYMEVVGFWTPEYLEKKLEKLGRVEEPLLLSVNENLACTQEDFDAGHDVIFYDKKIPLVEVMNHLRRLEEKQDKRELEQLRKEGLPAIEEDVVAVDQVAAMTGVGSQAIRSYVEEEDDLDWVVAGSVLARPSVLDEIADRIDGLEDRSLAMVEPILADYGLGVEAVEQMGYTVTWSSLDPDDAVVTKKQQ